MMRFEPVASAVDQTLWMQLNKRKLDSWRLDETPRTLRATYSPNAHRELAAPLQVAAGALDDETTANQNGLLVRVRGEVVALNEKSSLRDPAVKEAAMARAVLALRGAIATGEALDDPSLLTRPVLLVHADHKAYVFSYRFAFPALTPATPVAEAAPPAAPPPSLCAACQAHADAVRAQTGALPAAWLVLRDGEVCVPLANASANAGAFGESLADASAVLAFVDHARAPEHPGWVLRNLLALVASTALVGGAGGVEAVAPRTVPCLSLRFRHGTVDASASRMFYAAVVPEPVRGDRGDADAPAPATGWELNSKGVAAPRVAKLTSAFDPHALADQAVELNLKLMRWRANPSLDVDAVRRQRCLLVGAGTLGCAVARTLLGWGIQHITFVDNGMVSYSNPVRQSLYEFADASSTNGPRPKAIAAAESLRRIHPSVEARGEVLSIPCPGHPTAPSDAAESEAAYERLSSLVAGHDVVFLLTDSRESRWLPTALCALHNTPCFNAALGYDTFLAMRHGHGCASGRLGCYFCNDIVAPTDSTTNRTMDQQCTVARPGLSFIAAALVVELMAACTQHTLGAAAPAMDAGKSDDDEGDGGAVLGPVPHALRGSLHGFTMAHFPAQAFDRCVACSLPVVDALRARGYALVHDACADPKCLSALTGLDELLEASLDFDEEDEEDEFGGEDDGFVEL